MTDTLTALVARNEQMEEAIAEAIAFLEQGEKAQAEEVLREVYLNGPVD